jgi:hypothetical protein
MREDAGLPEVARAVPADRVADGAVFFVDGAGFLQYY